MISSTERLTDRSDDPPAPPPEDLELLIPLVRWCVVNLRPRRTVCTRFDSYTYKHRAERALGQYVANAWFKYAARIAGFEPIDPREMNWRYRAAPERPYSVRLIERGFRRMRRALREVEILLEEREARFCDKVLGLLERRLVRAREEKEFRRFCERNRLELPGEEARR